MASDRVRYYDPETLTPVTAVAKAKGDGTRKPTIKDARKHGYLAGVTSIIEELQNFGIVKYKLREVVKACMAYPYDGSTEGLSELQADAALGEYERMIYAKASEHAEKAAEEGTAIHRSLNIYLEPGHAKPDDPIHLRICEEVGQFLRDVDAKNITTEHSIASRELGFAGTPDLYFDADRALLEKKLGLSQTEGRVQVVCDFKTTSFKSFKKPYESWKIQLGAYRGLTGCDDGTFLLQLVADREYGDTKWINHEEPDKWWECFQHLFGCWVILHDYDPRRAA